MERLVSPITEIRKDLGWTMGRLAIELGITPQAIGKMEKGLMRLPVKCLEPLESLGYDSMAILWAQELFICSRRRSRIPGILCETI